MPESELPPLHKLPPPSLDAWQPSTLESPRRPDSPLTQAEHLASYSAKSYETTLFLAIALGLFGGDHFYLGNSRSGLLKLLTFGGVGFWMAYDIWATLSGRRKDKWGGELKRDPKPATKAWVFFRLYFSVLALLMLITALVMVAREDLEVSSTVSYALIVGALVIAVAILYLKHRPAGTRLHTLRKPSDSPSASVISELESLALSRNQFSRLAATGISYASSITDQLDSLLSHATELFSRLDNRTAARSRRAATHEYSKVLGRLNVVLSERYLLDLVVNPHLWDKTEQRIRLGQRAIMRLDAQVIANIRQINTNKNLEFDSHLDTLLNITKLKDLSQHE